MKTQDWKKNCRTLIGNFLLIVTAIGFAGVSCNSKVASLPDEMRAKANLQMLEASLIRYKVMAGSYPTKEQGLQALLVKPTADPIPVQWNQLVEPGALNDPWGNLYQYRYPGIDDPENFDLWSWGPDGLDGTEDDILSKDD